MTTQLTPETNEQLQRYVNGDLSNAELAEWLAAVEYDSELPLDERDALAQISLVLLEAEEGRRGPSEVLGVVAAILASAAPGEPVTSVRTGSRTSWQGEPSRTATETRLQRVGIQPGTASS